MRTKEKDNGIVLLKLSLYCISLWILMFMLIVLKIDVSMLSGKIEWNTLKDFICANVFCITGDKRASAWTCGRYQCRYF